MLINYICVLLILKKDTRIFLEKKNAHFSFIFIDLHRWKYNMRAKSIKLKTNVYGVLKIRNYKLTAHVK